ncbi:mitogen-activated protein kinase [Thecamonas trahens ATCC 50062]|uniref:Mitogen-activated protein kinase n=1 Tax=Thecamonas trahens ATCC 50062 TaxID=461836 RepID=A0A0L0D7E5_THETB|nr:mitogen-activated protein kinase [Thecamonas trahens ATCC 50062]KNC48105.1 mitogen-activated protein kinase [Thecamonas trahens ATCC 50062]|eukprot:XP_013758679.1 mitogen-activated protein kinase [Thecamonas trahens ATCC 50062]
MVSCLGFPSRLPSSLFDMLAIRTHGDAFFRNLTAGAISLTDPRVVAIVDDIASLADVHHYSAAATELQLSPADLSSYRSLALGHSLMVCAVLASIFALCAPKASIAGPTALDLARFAADPATLAALLDANPDRIPLTSSLATHLTSANLQSLAAIVSSASALLQHSAVFIGSTSLTTAWNAFHSNMFLAQASLSSPLVRTEALADLEALRLESVLAQVAPPRITHDSGSYHTRISVGIYSPTANAVIHYTLDGSLPSHTSPRLASPLLHIDRDGNVALRAIAIAPGSLRRLPSLQAATSSSSVVLAAEEANSCGPNLVDDNICLRPSDVECLHLVGSGSFGAVYTGSWSGTSVAIKHLRLAPAAASSPGIVDAIIQEVGTLAAITAPNVVHILGALQTPLAIVSEFAERGSLAAILTSNHTILDASIIFKWANDITAGLAALHAAGVVHGSLNPRNVLLDSNWVAKLADYGLAPAKGDLSLVAASHAFVTSTRKLPPATTDQLANTCHSSRSNPGGPPLHRSSRSGQSSVFASHDLLDSSITSAALGDSTLVSIPEYPVGDVSDLYYAAPEVIANGRAAVSKASDLFALAITLWELTSRRRVYADQNPLAVAVEVARGARPPLEDIPPTFALLGNVTSGLWAQSPDERLPLTDALSLMADLFDPEVVIFPSEPQAPFGSILAVKVIFPQALSLLAANPGLCHSALVESLTMVVDTVEAAAGCVLASHPTSVLFSLHNPSDVHPIALALHARSPTVGPPVLLAVRGVIETTRSSHGEYKLGGAVIDDLLNLESRVVAAPASLPSEGCLALVADRLADELKRAHAASGTAISLISPPPALASLHPPILRIELPAVVAPSLNINSTGSSMSKTSTTLETPRTLLSERVLSSGKPRSSFGSSGLNDTTLLSHELVTTSTLAAVAFLSGAATEKLIRGASRPVRGSYANLRRTRWQTQSVVVKHLVTQSFSNQELLAIAADVASATIAGSASKCLSPPLALCIEPPNVAIIFPRLRYCTLRTMAVHPDVVRARYPSLLVPSLDIVCALGTALIDAIEALHMATGAAHGALTPSNVSIVLSSSGFPTRVILSDFGLAAIRRLVGPKCILPSASYASPEVLSGKTIAKQADTFTFGSMLYQIACGQPAFTGNNETVTAARVIAGDHAPIPSMIPEPLARLIIDCWAPIPERRPTPLVIRHTLSNVCAQALSTDWLLFTTTVYNLGGWFAPGSSPWLQLVVLSAIMSDDSDAGAAVLGEDGVGLLLGDVGLCSVYPALEERDPPADAGGSGGLVVASLPSSTPVGVIEWLAAEAANSCATESYDVLVLRNLFVLPSYTNHAVPASLVAAAIDAYAAQAASGNAEAAPAGLLPAAVAVVPDVAGQRASRIARLASRIPLLRQVSVRQTKIHVYALPHDLAAAAWQLIASHRAEPLDSQLLAVFPPPRTEILRDATDAPVEVVHLAWHASHVPADGSAVAEPVDDAIHLLALPAGDSLETQLLDDFPQARTTVSLAIGLSIGLDDSDFTWYSSALMF